GPVMSRYTGIDEIGRKEGDQARSATLPLPAVILEKVREGEALGPVMSRYTGIDEIGRKEGDQARSAT
ncbi:DUF84 family protein, partial [Klebsiella pneumoniae]|uniref:DUF84 family protein n=1 Tax=Klebsiella pneumoniae TaxID=573 RepID=UPI0011402544